MTPTPDTEPVPGARDWSRKKWMWWALGAFLFLLIAIPLGTYVGLLVYASGTLRDAEAEADRLDPGWRHADLEKKRAPVPPEEDAAVRVQAALDRMPPDFQSTNPKIREALGPHRGVSLDEEISKVPANVRLNDDQAAGLEAEIAELAPALAEASPLAGMTRGRSPVVFDKVVFETKLPFTQSTRKVARLLRLSAYHHAQNGRIDAALNDCRAILGVNHAIGEEPFVISQLVRMAEVASALSTMERVLSQGEATDAALARAQEALARQAKIPLTLIGMRGERASMYDVMGQLADGTISISALSDNNSPKATGPVVLAPHGRAYYQYNQGLILHFLNQAVEIGKLPIVEQRERWDGWKRLTKHPSSMLRRMPGMITYLMIPALEASFGADQRGVGMLGAMQVEIALERFRVANGRWPQSLDEVPKSILPETPIDPFTGKPIRIARVSDGWAVYCVGADLEDNGGNLDPRLRAQVRGFDWGFRLRDVGARGLPPEPSENPSPVEKSHEST